MKLNIALCDIKTENYVDAIEKCSDVIKKDGKNVKALLRRATGYRHNGELDNAKVYFNIISIE